ncbi:type I toxin-antitoxin system Ibs family toxin, partial [Escherichia coli]
MMKILIIVVLLVISFPA